MSDGHFEARKIGMRQNKEGVIISFVVQPDDFSSALAMVPIGARMMIGWAQIGDDEKPIAVLNTKPAEVRRCSVNHADYIGKCPGCHVALPGIPSQRGTTLDQAFVEPIAKSGGRGDSRERPAQSKQRFEQLPLSQQAGMRCAEEGYWRFLRSRGWDVDNADHAATVVRQACKVASRSMLDTNTFANNQWVLLEAAYQNWLTDQKYAGARR